MTQLTAFEKASKDIFLSISQNRTRLRELVLDVPQNPKLFSLCAHYNAVDKIILWNSDDDKMQLRLHIYSDKINPPAKSFQADIAQAHNHRWNFSSLILSGGYRHTLYREENSSLLRLIPTMVRQENVGDCYTLHHSQYHSIVEQPNTVSLLVRGPLEKESFQVIHETAEGIGWQNAPSLESPEEKKQKKMDVERYQMLVEKLIRLKVINN